MGTALSILSTDAREVNRESTAEATVQRPAAAVAATAAAAPYFTGRWLANRGQKGVVAAGRLHRRRRRSQDPRYIALLDAWIRGSATR